MRVKSLNFAKNLLHNTLHYHHHDNQACQSIVSIWYLHLLDLTSCAPLRFHISVWKIITIDTSWRRSIRWLLSRLQCRVLSAYKIKSLGIPSNHIHLHVFFVMVSIFRWSRKHHSTLLIELRTEDHRRICLSLSHGFTLETLRPKHKCPPYKSEQFVTLTIIDFAHPPLSRGLRSKIE